MSTSPEQAASGFSLRSMTSGDVPAAHRLTQQVGWPHTEKDWSFHLEQGHGWVATDKSGMIIATTLYWLYGGDSGTLGLVIVDDRFRGEGIAAALMEKIVLEIGHRRVRLIATDMAYKLYRKYGFESVYGIEQRQGTISNITPLPAHGEAVVRAAREADYNSIRMLDHNAVRMDRSAVINCLLTSSNGYVLDKGGHVIGCLLVRDSGLGRTFGPLIASNQADAKLLLSHALSEHPGFCRIDIPEDAGALGHWLDQLGLPAVDRGTLMQNFNRELLKTGGYQNYSLISQGLG